MYTLRFPFEIPEGREVIVEKEVKVTRNGLNYTFNKQDRFYVLKVEGFDSEEEAKSYLSNIWSGFMWLLLHKGITLDAAFWVNKTFYSDDPEQTAKNLGFKEPVDGIIVGNIPSVYFTNKRIRMVTAGQVGVNVSCPANDVLGLVFEGSEFRRSDKIIQNSKLKVALELYGAYHTEVSANAKFLTLVMAIEVLAVGVKKTKVVLNLMDKWEDEANGILSTLDKDSDDYLSLESLLRELSFRREDSIRRQVRNIVYTVLQRNGDEDAAEIAKKFQKIYDCRSTLVHDGKLEQSILNKSSGDAKLIVERILKVLFLEEAKTGIKLTN